MYNFYVYMRLDLGFN